MDVSLVQAIGIGRHRGTLWEHVEACEETKARVEGVVADVSVPLCAEKLESQEREQIARRRKHLGAETLRGRGFGRGRDCHGVTVGRPRKSVLSVHRSTVIQLHRGRGGEQGRRQPVTVNPSPRALRSRRRASTSQSPGRCHHDSDVGSHQGTGTQAVGQTLRVCTCFETQPGPTPPSREERCKSQEQTARQNDPGVGNKLVERHWHPPTNSGELNASTPTMDSRENPRLAGGSAGSAPRIY